MSLTASSYDDDGEGNSNRLRFWLSLDQWSLNEAALLFLDIDPDSVHRLATGDWNYFESFSGRLWIEYDYDSEGFPVPVGVDREGLNVYVTNQQVHLLTTLQQMHNDNVRLLSRYDEASPTEWIALALEKKITVPWLEWARNKELIEAQRDLPEFSGTPKGDGATSISRIHVSDKLAILNQASQRFWANTDRSDRSTHPTNNEVVAWLCDRGYTQSLAEKAATIIRPDWAPTGRKPEE